jgi:hypothetical protein
MTHTADLWDNPLGTDGFEVVEYATHRPEELAQLFARLGFTAVARHRLPGPYPGVGEVGHRRVVMGQHDTVVGRCPC